MSPEAVVISLVSGVMGVLTLLTGWALNQKVSGVDKKLDGLDAKVTQLGEHRARTDERLSQLERWRESLEERQQRRMGGRR